MPVSFDKLLAIILSDSADSWNQRNKEAFDGLFGGQFGRYRADARNCVTLRAPEMSTESGIPFPAYIHPANPPSGAYGGMSFVIFPVPGEPCLIAMVVGTQGLAPDERILGRPGHARRMQAI